MTKEKITKCDMCGAEIRNGKCDCGIWTSPEENENNPIKLSLEQFHEMKRFTFTSDMPHLGCAMVLFRGDYNDCKKVEEFIYKMKNRPFYTQSL